MNLPDARLFPTAVIGSLPRPRWVWEIVEDRVHGRIESDAFERRLDDAVREAIQLQERAGLDVISDGEWRRENYARVFADSIGGFQRGQFQRGALTLEAVVVERLDVRGPIVCAAADFLRRNTDRKVMVALPSPCTISDLMWHPELSTPVYPSREAFVEACIPILRDEIRALDRVGVDVVQLDEPLLPRLASPSTYYPEGEKALPAAVELSVRSINAVADGLDGIDLTVHLCHAYGGEYHATPGAAELLQSAVERFQVNRLAMEFNSTVAQSLQCLDAFPADKLLGLGVIDPKNSDVETPELIVERAERALHSVDKERLVLNPDCGFATTARRSGDLDTAYRKLAALCSAAKTLRKRYGNPAAIE